MSRQLKTRVVVIREIVVHVSESPAAESQGARIRDASTNGENKSRQETLETKSRKGLSGTFLYFISYHHHHHL